MTTTLLEGSIKIAVSDNHDALLASRQLVPGEQAHVSDHEQDIRVKEVNPAFSNAWIKGQFSFSSAGLKDVLADISRWYNVRIEYGVDVSGYKNYEGLIQRTIPLSKVLSMLERLTGDLTFTIDEDKVIRVAKTSKK